MMNETGEERVADESTELDELPELLTTYARSEIGKSILGILVKSMEVANDENSGNWATITSKHGVNLRVSQINVLALSRRKMEIVVIADDLGEEVRRSQSRFERMDEHRFKWIEGEAHRYKTDLAFAVEHWDSIRLAHYHAIKEAARSAYKQPKHSRALIDYLKEKFDLSFLLTDDVSLLGKEPDAEHDDDSPTTSKADMTAGRNPSFDGIIQSLEKDGLLFSREVVANYVLALQAKRFAILTGISGTGKTRIAMGVAQYFHSCISATSAEMPDEAVDIRVQSEDGGGDGPESRPFDGPVIEDRNRSEVVPVRPDWVDNRGLLGYFNPVIGEYSPTPFLRLLLEAGREEERAKREQREPLPFFVILDEMNLARIEHYFSDFLSALESGEKIPLHEAVRTESGDKTGIQVPRKLAVPDNVFFTGTVNVDETTYMFSPKVLDRAFTIELDQVDLKGYTLKADGGRPTEPGLDLSGETLQLTRYRKPERDDWLDFSKVNGGRLHKALLEIHSILEEEHRHFGYRVANEIARFVNLAGEQSADRRRATIAAFDLALVQKVLPKFHGTQQELETVLNRLFNFAVHGPGRGDSLDDAVRLDDWKVVDGRLRAAPGAKGLSSESADLDQTAAVTGETGGHASGDAPTSEESVPSAGRGVSPAFPRTAAKISRMLRRLEQRGFTSFIE